MDDPDVVLLVDPHADRHAEQPVERLRPERIDLEHRGLHVRALCLRLVLQHRLTDAEADDGRGEHRAEDEFTLLPWIDHGRLPFATKSIAAGQRAENSDGCSLFGWGDYRQTQMGL